MRNIRRSRGYSYEHTLVQRLNSEFWNARRLGGSSTGLPDIIAVNNIEAVLLSIEAKSGTGDALYVPSDQIYRCLQIRDMFSFYKSRHAILAFKFMRKKRFKRKGKIVYEHRKLLEYYKIADKLDKINDITMIKCTYQGKTFFIRGNECTKLYLPNYTMPFQKVGVTKVQNLIHDKSILKTKRRRAFISPYSHVSYASRWMKSITSDQMYMIENNSHNLIGMHRVYMMENAGHGLADFIVNKFKIRLKEKKIVALCGLGNNGGDGFVASRHLTCYCPAYVTVILFGYPSDIRSEEAHINWEILQKMDSVEVIFSKDLNEYIKAKINKADIIIDGIFGTGIKGEIRYPNAHVIDLINSSKAYVVSIDVPSGLDPNTGIVHEKCVKANATVTFHRMKKGLLKNKKYTGTIHVERIGIPPEAERGVL